MGHEGITGSKRLPRIHAAIPSTPRLQSQNMIARELMFGNIFPLFIYFSKNKVQMEMGIKPLPFPSYSPLQAITFTQDCHLTLKINVKILAVFSYSGKGKNGNGNGLMLPLLLFKVSQTQSSFPPEIHFTPFYDIIVVSCDPQESELLFLPWDLPKTEVCVDKFSPVKPHTTIFYR